MAYGKIKKAQHKEFAFSICAQDMDELNSFGLAKSTIQNYLSYAKGSKTDRAEANIIYKALSQDIRKHIDHVIDTGYDSGLSYRYRKGPKQSGPHSKVTTPRETSQLKLKFETQPKTNEIKPLKHVDRTDEVIKLLSATLDSIKLLLTKM